MGRIPDRGRTLGAWPAGEIEAIDRVLAATGRDPWID
jgi:hypothetical protein